MRIQRIQIFIILFLFMETSLGFYIIKYTFRTKNQIWTYQSDDEITCFDTTSTGALIGIGGRNGSISLVAKGKPTPRWRYSGEFEVQSVRFSDRGDYLVALDGNSTISLFSQTPHLREGEIAPLWRHRLPASKIGGIFSSGGIPSMVYVVASSGGSIHLLSKSGDKIWEYRSGADEVVIALSADGSRIAAGDSRGNLYILKIESAIPLWSFPIQSRIVSIAISFDNRYVVAGGVTEEGEGRINLFSLGDGEPIYDMWVDDPVRTVHISYDGKRVIADKEDGTAIIVYYDGSTINEDTLHIPKGIRIIKFSPFGSFTATCNPEGEIYLYYLPRPAPLWRFIIQDEKTFLAITRNGESVFVSSSDKVYLLSNTRPTEMIPGSRIGWAVVFLLGVAVALSSIVLARGGLKLTRIERSDYLNALAGFLIGSLIGILITGDIIEAFLICSVGSAVGSLIGWRGKSIISFISGCYIGCFGSGAAGYLLGLLIWFSGDERNIVQLTLFYVFNGLKIGVLFGPLGAILGTLVSGLIIPKFIKTDR